eukprot:635423-Pyramimonas_sp.AAC.1
MEAAGPEGSRSEVRRRFRASQSPARAPGLSENDSGCRSRLGGRHQGPGPVSLKTYFPHAK